MVVFSAALLGLVFFLYKRLHVSFDLKALYNWIVGIEETILEGTEEAEEEIVGKQVYNIPQNVFTYDEAKLVCKSFDSELATVKQLMEAYKRGANWCTMGWVDDQIAAYPIQQDFWNKLSDEDMNSEKCGMPGINAGYFKNKNFKFSANCFGVKPNPQNKERINVNYVNEYSESDKQVLKYKRNREKYSIAPFNKGNWSEYQ
tara:strand:+ start:213 stop:818 length:606 start_codon:yes stop_codon:yes gene_type:complete